MNKDFILELFAFCFKSKEMFKIVKREFKYQYLGSAEEKSLLKYFIACEEILPSIAICKQHFLKSETTINFLCKVEACQVDVSQFDIVIQEIENFIKDAQLLLTQEKLEQVYSNAKLDPTEKTEKIDVILKEFAEIANFKIEKSPTHFLVFKDFAERQEQPKENKIVKKAVFGIQRLDDFVSGVDSGTTCLFSAQSNVGKSTALQYFAMVNSFLGKKVIYFHLEGGKEKAQSRFDNMLVKMVDRMTKFEDMSTFKKNALFETIAKVIANRGEIIVEAPKKINQINMDFISSRLEEISSEGEVGLVVIDYMSLLRDYPTLQEDKRLMKLGEDLVNIAGQFDVPIISAHQINENVPHEKTQDPDYVFATEYLLHGKDVIKSFTTHISLNQTKDEYQRQTMRAYVQKNRYGEKNQVVHFATDFPNNLFHDKKRTKELFG